MEGDERARINIQVDSSETTLKHKASFRFAVVNLINATIGSGILGLAFTMLKMGVLLGAFSIIAIGLLSIWTAHTLLECHQIIEDRRNADAGVEIDGTLKQREVVPKSYEAVCEGALGSAGRVVCNLASLLINWGACCSYLIVIGDVLPSAFLTENVDPEHFEISSEYSRVRALLLSLVTCFILLPLCLLHHVSSLGFVSAASVVIYLAFVIGIVARFLFASDIFEAFHFAGSNLANFSKQSVDTFPIVFFVYAFHPMIFPIFAELHPSTISRMKSVVTTSTAIGASVYTVVAVCGYLAYQSALRGDILLNLEAEHKFVLDILRFAFVISVIFTFPVLHYPARVSLHALILEFPNSEWCLGANHQASAARHLAMPSWVRITLTLLLVSLALVVALTTRKVETVLGLTGAVAGVLVTCAIPMACYLSLVPRSINHIFAVLYLIVGLASGTIASLSILTK
eukprot:c10209_g1_i1.p1 GENE.c10209_g1_i1~~c10209_g1_i1.p1  ORF type:complete len:458 (+),score=98.11 c10209_g1_i1:51-1424(+)